jgi:hypothetical protein
VTSARQAVSAAAFACTALILAACSGGSDKPTAVGPSAVSPGVTTGPPTVAGPTPVVTQSGGVHAPLTSAKLSSLFGTSLSGPTTASGPNPTFNYGDVHSNSHLVISVTVYSPQLLRSRGTTPADFYAQNEDPTGEQVSGIGKKANLVQDQITVLTNHDYVLQVAANQLVDESRLKSAAQAAAQSL